MNRRGFFGNMFKGAAVLAAAPVAKAIAAAELPKADPIEPVTAAPVPPPEPVPVIAAPAPTLIGYNQPAWYGLSSVALPSTTPMWTISCASTASYYYKLTNVYNSSYSSRTL